MPLPATQRISVHFTLCSKWPVKGLSSKSVLYHRAFCFLLSVTADAFEQTPGGSFKRIASSSSVVGSLIGGYSNVYSNVWKALQLLANDAVSSVTEPAKKLIGFVKHKVGILPI